MKICVYYLFVVPLRQISVRNMARKINYIDPVESIQGLIGSKQDLRYAANDNKGYYAPAGQINAARNYQTRLIGQVRKRTGVKYYSVRKKSSFNANPATLHACALMAGARLVAGSWMHDLRVLPELQAYATRNNIYRQFNSFYQWLFHEAYWRLSSYILEFDIADSTTHIPLYCNPWQTEPVSDVVPGISEYNLTKFWTELCPNGIYLYINGQRIRGVQSKSWQYYFDNSYLNSMDFHVAPFYDIEYVMSGSFYVRKEGGGYVENYNVPTADSRYYLTAIPPTH